MISERDILGTQLVRRNDELALLYEKIKIQQSVLNKGEVQYNQRLEDIRVLKLEIKKLRREKAILQKSVANVEDLRSVSSHRLALGGRGGQRERERERWREEGRALWSWPGEGHPAEERGQRGGSQASFPPSCVRFLCQKREGEWEMGGGGAGRKEEGREKERRREREGRRLCESVRERWKECGRERERERERERGGGGREGGERERELEALANRSSSCRGARPALKISGEFP